MINVRAIGESKINTGGTQQSFTAEENLEAFIKNEGLTKDAILFVLKFGASSYTIIYEK